ncbi:hypothetical protein RB11805 [Rhodopirellula baltica SH 1]|uniref:Uncharacterized protein n=1 Tax=Rhodopirellula baltica (strain DSM 10527 / NCIMB 13988 / SH1) TaxID=243090 RepID=Q7UJM1_RHOBA|nr:hypothetical protein RB11805 [Rhodopirellula baltica SH 1]
MLGSRRNKPPTNQSTALTNDSFHHPCKTPKQDRTKQQSYQAVTHSIHRHRNQLRSPHSRLA